MAREQSPPSRRRGRSRSRSPRGYRRSSPDYRRRSPSPRRASPHYRRSPSPRRERRDDDYQRDELPREFRSRTTGQSRPRDPDDVSEDDIKAENFQEFRRLKRAKMMERNVRCIWRNTPSPPPEEKDRILRERREKLHAKHTTQNGAHTHGAAANGHADASADGDATLDPELLALALGNVPAEGTADGAAEAAAEEVEDEVETDISRREVVLFTEWLAEQKRLAEEEAEARRVAAEEDAVVGPAAPDAATLGIKADYGTHLRPGEGDAMAAYVQSGQRIPRRGEVGLDSTQIEAFERVGYVMSGNRHARMNAVRIRKENQVYTAEEKAALAMFNFEENKRKEAKILDEMKRLVERTLGTEDEEGPAPPPVD